MELQERIAGATVTVPQIEGVRDRLGIQMKTHQDRTLPRNTGLKFGLLQLLASITRKWSPRGINRLLFLLYHPDRRYFDHFEIVMPYNRHQMIHVNTASYIEWCIFFYGFYEPEIAAIIKRVLKPGFCAIDVGANVGGNTLIMAASVGRTGQVIAVEPHPAVWRRLINNLSLNGARNVIPFEIALSDTRGRLQLHSYGEQDANQATSSFYSADTSRQQAFEVETDTLDELLRRCPCSHIELIKIDTEGSDYKVLVGALNTIEMFRPYILFEYDEEYWSKAGSSFESAVSLFARLNYSLYLVRRADLTRINSGALGSGNILAVPEYQRTK